MDFKQNITLFQRDITNISSDYIFKGRSLESWEIEKITINGKTALMYVNMSTIYGSKENFHLSIYLAEEMASQLMIICGHTWAGLKEKKKEVWMLESHTKNVRAIKEEKNILVELNLKTLKKRENKIFGIGEFTITDSKGGLIKITQKGILA